LAEKKLHLQALALHKGAGRAGKKNHEVSYKVATRELHIKNTTSIKIQSLHICGLQDQWFLTSHPCLPGQGSRSAAGEPGILEHGKPNQGIQQNIQPCRLSRPRAVARQSRHLPYNIMRTA